MYCVPVRHATWRLIELLFVAWTVVAVGEGVGELACLITHFQTCS